MEWVRSVVGLTSVVHRGSVISPGSQTRDLGNPVYGDSTERIGDGNIVPRSQTRDLGHPVFGDCTKRTGTGTSFPGLRCETWGTQCMGSEAQSCGD
jgi:hypothetical protein